MEEGLPRLICPLISKFGPLWMVQQVYRDARYKNYPDIPYELNSTPGDGSPPDAHYLEPTPAVGWPSKWVDQEFGKCQDF